MKCLNTRMRDIQLTECLQTSREKEQRSKEKKAKNNQISIAEQEERAFCVQCQVTKKESKSETFNRKEN